MGVLAPRGLGTSDPHFATAHFDRMAASWTHAALVRFRPGSTDPTEIEPDLAEGWEASPDKRLWTFRLRPDARYHGGFGPVEAEDVVFSLRKAADPARSACAGDYAPLEAIEAPDPRTVRIVARQPMPDLLGLVANYAGGFVLSRRAHEAAREGVSPAAIGAGPFRLVGQNGNESAGFAAHDGYFRGRPALRRIEYRFLSSLATGDLAFQAGELDVVEGQQDPAWIARLRAGGAVVDVVDPAELSWLHLDVTKPPLDDPRVRRAVALAVSRPELAAWRGTDLARPARGVIPANYLGFATDAAPPDADVTEARRLLAEAGYRDGIALRTVHTSNPVMLGAIGVVQAQLRRAGIALEVQTVEHLTYHQMIRRDLSPVVHYAAARFPTADAMLTQFFHSRSTVGRPVGVTNFSHCAAADDPIDAARSEPDGERRLELWADAQRRILAAGCAVPLIETRQVWARRADFEYGFPFEGAMATGPLLTERSHFRG